MAGARIPEYATPWTDVDVIDKMNSAVMVTLEDSITSTDPEDRDPQPCKIHLMACYGLQTKTIFSFQNVSVLSFSQ